ncbi:MAG: rhomboid family intramembrane serine protease [Candidatus Pacearchaeota archaeon]|nr:rhomboid family intramembrane serine protease [Candidatus Pacearchaeota archaeon]
MGYRFYALKLTGICVVVFILQLAIRGFSDLFVLSNLYVVEVWRFVSAIFLHANFGHLLYNMFALALFGSILEKIIGSKKFLLVFFASGVLANVVAVNFYTSSLGASGAIFGIFGALIILRPLMIVWVYGLPMPMIIAGILWAVFDIIGLFVPSNIGHIAHLSGMVVGLAFGIFWRGWVKKREKPRIIIELDEESMRKWEDNYLR